MTDIGRGSLTKAAKRAGLRDYPRGGRDGALVGDRDWLLGKRNYERRRQGLRCEWCMSQKEGQDLVSACIAEKQASSKQYSSNET